MAGLRVAGISFDHMHMGDLLREIDEHPDAEIAAIYDPDPKRMEGAIATFGIPADRVFTDLQHCLDAAKPDLVVLCSAPAEHANYVEAIAPSGAHILVEKPFASSIADARRMIAAVPPGQKLAINWPLAWYRSHNTAKRLVDEGRIGELLEFRSYGGNRGPLYHLADKIAVTDEEVEAQKPQSWFYKRDAGGGSLIDYMGYGTTFGTWFHGGAEPVEITTVIDETPGIEVDQHSITRGALRPGAVEVRDAVGHDLRPMDTAADPQMRLHPGGYEGRDLELRLRRFRLAAAARERTAGRDSGG